MGGKEAFPTKLWESAVAGHNLFTQFYLRLNLSLVSMCNVMNNVCENTGCFVSLRVLDSIYVQLRFQQK